MTPWRFCAECHALTDPGDICPHLPDVECIPCALGSAYPCGDCQDIAAQDAADERAVDAWVEARHE